MYHIDSSKLPVACISNRVRSENDRPCGKVEGNKGIVSKLNPHEYRLTYTYWGRLVRHGIELHGIEAKIFWRKKPMRKREKKIDSKRMIDSTK